MRLNVFPSRASSPLHGCLSGSVKGEASRQPLPPVPQGPAWRETAGEEDGSPHLAASGEAGVVARPPSSLLSAFPRSWCVPGAVMAIGFKRRLRSGACDLPGLGVRGKLLSSLWGRAVAGGREGLLARPGPELAHRAQPSKGQFPEEDTFGASILRRCVSGVLLVSWVSGLFPALTVRTETGKTSKL